MLLDSRRQKEGSSEEADMGLSRNVRNWRFVPLRM